MDATLYEKTGESARFILDRLPYSCTYAVILGTGMDGFVQSLEDATSISYAEIPHFHKGEVESHRGQLTCGISGKQRIWVLAGRSHYYEGFSAAEVAFPVLVLASLGVQHVFLTNAAGGVSPHYRKGDIVMVEDHINFLPDNPLRGKNDDRLGPRFPDMLYAYNRDAIKNFSELAKKSNLNLKKGVYLALPGPSLETPAEYNMAYRLGADLVGMSTVPEVIAARYAGLEVSAFSIVSNVCYPRQVLTPTTLEDVLRVVRTSSEKLTNLLQDYFSSPP